MENIRRNGVFSANLIIENNLALADCFGTVDGRDEDKLNITVEWENGVVLMVPILSSSPLSFELEVDKEISTGENDATVLLCRIRKTFEYE